ncbi:MAG: hypothetical protein IPK04_18820 [Bdellovibrionales bacterium]|nr:hypothetical protein [Bdellovibrionales bacterium]
MKKLGDHHELKIQIRRLNELPSDFEELVAESQEQEHDFIRKMKVDWDAGKNRFQLENEVVNVDPYANDPSIGRVLHVYVLQEYRSDPS